MSGQVPDYRQSCFVYGILAEDTRLHTPLVIVKDNGTIRLVHFDESMHDFRDICGILSARTAMPQNSYPLGNGGVMVRAGARVGVLRREAWGIF